MAGGTAPSAARSQVEPLQHRPSARSWCFNGLLEHVAICYRADGATPRRRRLLRPPPQNGLQIFAGGVPIFRGQTVVGAIGVSGDGIDQDDMVAFLGLDRAARAAQHRHRSGAQAAARRPSQPRRRQPALGPVPLHPLQRLARPERLQGEMTVRSPPPSPCPAPGPRRGHGGGRRGCPDSEPETVQQWRRCSDGPGRRSPCPPPPEPPADPSAVTVAAARGLSGRLHPGARPLAADGEFRRQREVVSTPTTRARSRAIGRSSARTGSSTSSAISDSVFEPRSTPVPVGIQSAPPGSNDVFGDTEQLFASQTRDHQRLADQGRHRLQAAGHRGQADPGLQLQLRLGAGGALPRRQPARRAHAHRRLPRRPGSLPRLPHPQRLRPLRLRFDPRRHPALLHRLPRLPVPGQPAGRAPVRHPRRTISTSTTSPGSGGSRRTPTAA